MSELILGFVGVDGPLFLGVYTRHRLCSGGQHLSMNWLGAVGCHVARGYGLLHLLSGKSTPFSVSISVIEPALHVTDRARTSRYTRH